MDREIHKEFFEGIYEVYSTVFTDGINDGIELFRFSDDNISSLYKETKVKVYKKPVLLVAKALTGIQVTDIEVGDEIMDKPTFKVPYKSLFDKGVACQTEADWDYLEKSYIKFHEAFYEVKEVKPETFIEDSFMFISFICEYRRDITNLILEQDEEVGD